VAHFFPGQAGDLVSPAFFFLPLVGRRYSDASEKPRFTPQPFFFPGAGVMDAGNFPFPPPFLRLSPKVWCSQKAETGRGKLFDLLPPSPFFRIQSLACIIYRALPFPSLRNGETTAISLLPHVRLFDDFFLFSISQNPLPLNQPVSRPSSLSTRTFATSFSRPSPLHPRYMVLRSLVSPHCPVAEIPPTTHLLVAFHFSYPPPRGQQTGVEIFERSMPDAH